MCTLSWHPTRTGYWVLINRDERRTRPAALPPRRRRAGAIQFLAPTDPTGGGTWIGVNTRGVTVALLNRYGEEPSDPRPGTVSRGLLVAAVLGKPSAAAVIGTVADQSLGHFQPFTLVAIDRHARAVSVDWTGRELLHGVAIAPGLVRTSSGRDQRSAESIRAAAFAQLIRDPVTATQLAQFHRSHLPERGPFSVCMHREEAATQSLTVIRVTRKRAVMSYWDGPPCTDPTLTRRTLPLGS